MAKRPVFLPDSSDVSFVRTIDVEFKWFPGFSKSQRQRSIDSLHQAANRLGIASILEISGMSKSQLGESLSAFNLELKAPSGQVMTVECAYQGSKVFEKGGPYTDLYKVSSREAKTDDRHRTSGELRSFRFDGKKFPTEPRTFFYDLLYLQALKQQPNLAEQLEQYDAFSDIVFNPKQSFSCQAHSAALYVSLSRECLIRSDIFQDYIYYKELLNGNQPDSHKGASDATSTLQTKIRFPE